MRKFLRTVYLLWLPIAVLAAAIRAADSSELGLSQNHIFARNALAEQIADIKSQYGDEVDASLEGYDHDLFVDTASDDHGLDERPDENSPHAPLLLKKSIMPDGISQTFDALFKRASRNPNIVELNTDKAKVKAQYGGSVDLSLDGYDATLFDDDDDDDDEKLEKRALRNPKIAELTSDKAKVKADLGSNVDISLDGYDTTLLDDDDDEDEELEKRALRNPKIAELNSDKAKVKAVLGSSVDVSLDGYDSTLLDDDDDEEESEDDKIQKRALRNPKITDDLNADKARVKAALDSNVDLSLDGYDSTLLEDDEEDEDEELLRRSLPDDEEDQEEEEDESSEYLTAWDPDVHATALPAEDEPNVNDRYADVLSVDKLKREASQAAEEAKEDAKGFFENVKGWFVGAQEA